MVNAGAEKYKNQGNDEFKKGNHAKAIEFYTYATEMDPTNSIYFTNRSNAYFKMEIYDKSLRDAVKATTLDPKWAKGYYRAGLAYMELKQSQEALKSFEMALQLDPDNQTYVQEVARAKGAFMKGMSQAEILKTDGNAKFKAGAIDDAIKVYTSAINSAKSDEKDILVKADCYANRAACYRQLYKDHEVVADCTEAIKLVPDHVKAYIRRAQGYEQMEKYENALEGLFLLSSFSPPPSPFRSCALPLAHAPTISLVLSPCNSFPTFLLLFLQITKKRPSLPLTLPLLIKGRLESGQTTLISQTT